MGAAHSILGYLGLRHGICICLLAWGLVMAAPVRAQQSAMTGQSGLINMPDARLAPDGTFRIGYSNADPYSAVWTSLTLLPRLEFSGNFTAISGVPAFPSNPTSDYGDFKDKSVSGKLLLLEEGPYLPALAVGGRDFSGTQVFNAWFGAASKRLGDLDLSLGYGSGRIDGVFGGARYSPKSLPGWSLVAEYDANDYKNDFQAQLSGAAQFDKGMSYGLEYRWGWLGAQASYQHDKIGVNAYVSIPLQQREFIPKVAEPPPYTKITPRPPAREWERDPAYRHAMFEELVKQDFRHLRIGYTHNVMEVVLTNTRISQVSRAVGRAARVVYLMSPAETREIRITYTQFGVPVVTYSFFELKQLERYYNGLISRQAFSDYVSIEPVGPREFDAVEERTELLSAMSDPSALAIIWEGVRNAGALGGQHEDSLVNRFKFGPFFTPYINDPSGFFRYAAGIYGSYTRMLAERLYLDLYATWTIAENISDVTQPSNSLLPHVRSDIADYKAAADVKLQAATVTKYFKPTERVLARLTGGLLEEMFGGVEGQAMYVPRHNRWAADLWVDAVKQRDFDGWGFRDYSTVTALASYHQRLLMGLTGTVRAGRFLARDEGARFELKRRFRSGFEVGAWYTWTNGNDITSPGSPGSPYHDKGVWMRIPLETMLPSDTQAEAAIAFSPWTRDVGQMVLSPRDLYWNFESGQLFDQYEGDGLNDFADRRDDYALAPRPRPLFDARAFDRVLADASDSLGLLEDRRAWRALGIGLAITGASALLDSRADDWAVNNGSNGAVKTLTDIGNALPYVALGGAAFGALQDWDPRLARTSVTALEAGLGGWALAEGLAWTIGRAPPTAGQGSNSFSGFGGQGSKGSLPSGHTTAIWATVTPYAREYDMPWLYGVAALTNFARVADRKHWLSDTVAGALLGYGIGSVLWHGHRDPRREDAPAVGVSPSGVSVGWKFN